MNQGLPSPGVGLAAPNDPRLISRLAQPHNVSYINNKPPSHMTISRLVPSSSAAAAAAATITTITSSSFSAVSATNSSSQGGKAGALRLRFAPTLTTPTTITTTPNLKTNYNENASKINNSNHQDNTSEVEIIRQVKGETTDISTTQSPVAVKNSGDSNNMRRGPQLKMKSRPKKNQSFDTNNSPAQTSSSSPPANKQQHELKPTVSSQAVATKEQKDIAVKINPLTRSNIIPCSASSQTAVASQNVQKPEPTQGQAKPVISGSPSARPSPLSNIIRHLPAFQSSSSSKPASPKTQSPATPVKPQVATTTSAFAPSTTTTTSSTSSNDKTIINDHPHSMPEAKRQEAPRSNGTSEPRIGHPAHFARVALPESPGLQNTGRQSSPSSNNPAQQPSVPTPFSWDIYLDRLPAPVASKEAFKQAASVLENQFKPGMKLEARDPRNSSTWCLATVQLMEGPRLRLRFDGGDSMNDFFELINSENIRPVNSLPEEPLLPPMAFKGSLSTYPKFVEKVLMKSDTVVADPDCFIPPPMSPEKNLFKQGMKLEAIDKKNPYLICPATVGEVNGDDVKILFDGWKGSFDYICKYHSRDIFPVDWCRDNNHYIAAPNGWEVLLSNSPPKPGKQTSKLDRLTASSPQASSRPIPQSRTPSKEIHLAKVQLQPKNTPVTTPPSKTQARSNSPPKPQQAAKISQSTPKIREAKRKRSASPEPIPIVEARPQHFNDDDDPEFIHDQKATETNEEDKFQCQRTVPYDEWVKAHRVAETPPASSTTTSADGRSASNSSAALEDPSLSVAYSDSNSMASTSTVFDAPAPEPAARRGRPPKKIKLDAEVERLNVAFPPGSYISWSVSQVVNVIKLDETLAKYSTIFENHEIDGKAFGLLTTEVMINHMGLKIGPVLKIAELTEKVKRLRRFDSR